MTDEAIKEMRDLSLTIQERAAEIRALTACATRAMEDGNMGVAIHLSNVAERLAAETCELGERIELTVGPALTAGRG